MLEAIGLFFTRLLDESGNLILMFIITGVVFNVFAEIVKKQIFPKLTEEELAAGKVQKECPAWIGMIIGVVLTIVFLACAIGAYITVTPHCQLIGGFFFTPVWAVAYYVWQMACMKLVKGIMTLLFPLFMTGHKRPQKPPKQKVYKIPAGATVEYVDGNNGGEVTG